MKKAKNTKNTDSPLGGWGVGSKEPTQKDLLLMVFTILEVDANGPYRSGSKGLQVL